MNWRCVAAVLLMVGLTACGGDSAGDRTHGEEAGPQRLAAAMHTASAFNRAAAATPPLTVDTPALFDWAEWKYPTLFPKGGQDTRVVYQGYSYGIRVYPNGNLLGVSELGQVFGLGPFTQNVVQRFGTFSEFVPQVQADACLSRGYGCQAPVIDTQPLNVHALAGQPVSFSVSSSSTLPQSYQWQVSTDGGTNFTNIAGANAATCALPAVGLADDGRQYRVRVSNRDGMTTSNTLVLSVRSPGGTDFFPLRAGARWFYRRGDGRPPDVRRVVGERTFPGVPVGTVIETVDGHDGSVWQDLYVASADGVRVYTPDRSDEQLRAFDGLQLLRLPVVPGESTQQADQVVDSGIDIDHDGRPEPARVVVTLSVIGIEPLTTPAAQFHATLHLRQDIVWTLQPTAGGEPVEVRSVVDLWYADGVGEVKSLLRTTTLGITETSSVVLEAYQVGPARSDFDPPRWQTRGPEGPQSSISRVVWVTFDERIDAASIDADSLIVRDAQGQRMSGQVQLRDRTLSFEATSGLPPGDYTVQLAAGVRDPLGNAVVAGRSWIFSIDPNPPTILVVSPADGAQGVDLSVAVEINFSEPPTLASVKAASIYFYGDPPAGTVEAIRTVRGNTLVLTPRYPLQPGVAYRVQVSGIRDAAGHALAAGKSWTFSTVAGRFDAAVPLAGVMARATQFAVGDLNGDGRSDVLGWTSDSPPVKESGPHVQYGQANGRLSEPVMLPFSDAGGCGVSQPLLGDLNGDGRLDVVMACGLRVLLQSASGTLVAGQALNLPHYLPRLLPLDNNGRAALVTREGSRLHVWRWGGVGELQLSQTIDTGLSDISDVLSGDVNGDGRPDLVLKKGQTTLGDIAVLIRQPDGEFAPARFLDTNQGVHKAQGVALGDVNGDGRTDIVATLGNHGELAMIAVFHQTSTGGLAPPFYLPSYDTPDSLVVADINGDGRSDVVVSHPGWMAFGLYLQRPDGSLAPEERYRVPTMVQDFWEQIAVADLDGDGALDVLAGGSVIRQRLTTGAALPAAVPRRPGLLPLHSRYGAGRRL